MNRPLFSRSRSPYVVAFLAVSVLGLTACGENIFDIKWVNPSVQTVLLYSLAHPEINRPSGYDFVNRFPVEIHAPGATGLWDLLVDTEDGKLVFVPPRAIGLEGVVMILEMPGVAFDDLLEAPEDSTLYTRDQSVPVEVGNVYVLRTHEGPSDFGVPCVFFVLLASVCLLFFFLNLDVCRHFFFFFLRKPLI